MAPCEVIWIRPVRREFHASVIRLPAAVMSSWGSYDRNHHFSILNGVLYGLLLFMLSSGPTLIFSMMGVLNFAHAAFYMLGAYFAYILGVHIGFWPALIVAPIIVRAIGAFVERHGLRKVHHGGHVAELLFTFSLAFLFDAADFLWAMRPMPRSSTARTAKHAGRDVSGLGVLA